MPDKDPHKPSDGNEETVAWQRQEESGASRDPLIGVTIGDKYVVERELGQGGMGLVYLVRHKSLDKKFVIKIIRIAAVESDGEVALRRFKREARAIARIEHPHVVSVVDYDVYAGQPFIVMDFIDGQDLGEYMKAEHPNGMPVPLFLRLFGQMCDAMQAVHAEGIVHRDLKPSNIMVQQTKRGPMVKILDFGLVHIAHGELETTRLKLTGTGQLMGTPMYMAPEQCRDQEITTQTDIYAMGLLAYEMVTGLPPFHGFSFFELIKKQVKDPPEPLASKRDDLPENICKGIEVALMKEKNERHQTMSDFKSALGVLTEEDSWASSSYPIVTRQQMEAMVQAKRPWWEEYRWPLLIILAALIALVVMLLSGSDKPVTPTVQWEAPVLFDVWHPQTEWQLEDPNLIKNPVLVPNKSKFVLLQADGTVKIVDWVHPVDTKRFKLNSLNDGALCGGGTQLAAVTDSGCWLNLVDLESQQTVQWNMCEGWQTDPVKTVVAAHGKKALIALQTARGLFLRGEPNWDEPIRIYQWPAENGLSLLAFNQSDRWLVATNQANELAVFDITSEKKSLHLNNRLMNMA
ncbi:MAG: serine/threonine protein kinase [Acidobacteria bacterium]|nr:serine/threonine protein kinase [Acidobacteriota bacterium]